MKKILLTLIVTATGFLSFSQTPLIKSGTVVQPDPAVVDTNTDDFVFGSTSLNFTNVNSSNRFFFDKSQGAFRAGSAMANFWDTPQIGEYSFASGLNTIASAHSSFAGGSNSTASGLNSFAFGGGAQATANDAISIGHLTRAQNNYAIAMGHNTTASGIHSVAIGHQSNATGLRSVALGGSSNANGSYSISLGQSTANTDWSVAGGNSTATGTYSTSFGRSIANGNGTFAAGQDTEANGSGAFAGGYNNIATGLGSTALGRNNTATGAGTFVAGQGNQSNADYSSAFGFLNTADYNHEFVVGVASDHTNDYGGGLNNPLFVVGNGNNQLYRHNAMAVLRNGDVVITDLPQDFSTDNAAKAVVVDSDGRLRVTNAGSINTDNQTLSFDQSTMNLTISNGNTVTLTGFTDTDDQTLSFNNTTDELTIADGNTVIIPDEDEQILTYDQANNQISISNGNTITLVDTDTDDQTLSFNNSTDELTIADGNTVIIPDEDQQILSFNSTTNVLSISNGNSVTLPTGTGGGTNYTAGAGLSLAGNTFNANVKNGLRIEGSDNSMRLGGNLIESTDVNKDGYNMSFSGRGDFIVGSTQTDNQTGTQDNIRMFFTDNGAFRAGHASGTEWDQSAGNVPSYSVAIGDRTIANGVGASAFGRESTATGHYSFVTGSQSAALGGASFAAGTGNKASGLESIAMGRNSEAIEKHSVAIGMLAKADGPVAVAIGDNVVSSGYGSTALGRFSVATSEGSTAFGLKNNALGMFAVAGGRGNNSLDIASVALGDNNKANKRTSVAMGNGNTTNHESAVAIGHGNQANGWSSVAMGTGNTTNDDVNIALGHSNYTSGSISAAIGYNNKATGNSSFAVGMENNVSETGSAGIGLFNTSSGKAAVAIGDHTTAHSFAEVVVGTYNTSYIPSSANSWKISDRLFVVGRGSASNNHQDALIVYKNGNATLSGVLSQSSDERLKEDIQPLEGVWNKLENIGGYTYHWKKEANRTAEKQYGVIAQQVKEMFPELVTEDGEGYYAVNYSGLVPVLIEALKEERQARKDDLKRMESELAELRTLITNSAQTIEPATIIRKETLNSDEQSAFDLSAVKVFPNPTKGSVFLEMTSEKEAYYQISALDGKVLSGVNTYNENGISISHLASGTYLINVQVDNQVRTIKIIKE